MRKSLSLKMLIMTFSSFLILIFGIIASLYLYFDKLYEPLKINHMIQEINQFTDSFEKNNWSEDELYSEVFKFMKAQNVAMSIKPSTDIGTSSAGKNIGVRTVPNPKYFVFNNKMFTYPFDPFYYERNLHLPGIAAYNAKVSSSSVAGFGSSVTADINGKFIIYPDMQITTDTAGRETAIHEKDGITYMINTIPFSNTRQVDFMKQSTLSNGTKQLTSVSLSLQPVEEVKKFLLGIFPYLIAAAVLLSMIMVYVYSKTISKPIVSLTKTANRMANMELGIESNIKRKDEMGVLSASLNTLSCNLKNALDDLSQANIKLKEDYENELRQEVVRKEFIANVSHELKTPLGIIKSYMEGIQDGVKTEKRKHYMEVILDEITHMDHMIREMLEISRFDAGAVVFCKQTADFDDILKKVISIFEEKAAERSVTFELTGEFGICLIDEDKIQRVLNNLIENAVKYCDSHSVIKISGERSEHNLTVRIENDCPKYDDEVLSKIWDRFYKADTSHNRDIEGTGLGLAITRSILEGHGCEYGVNNTNSGICFYFKIHLLR